MFFPIQGDSYFASVVALLPMDGAHNSTSFPDFSPTLKTVTRSGSTIISTTLGIPTAYFPDNVSYLTLTSHADFAVGTGDYTISFRCRLTERTTTYTPVDFRPDGTNGAYPAILITSVGQLVFYFNSSNQIISASDAIMTNVDYAVSVCRSGSSTRLFLSGVQVGSTYSDSSSIPQSRGLIGYNGVGAGHFRGGYIWDFKYVRTALYTTNFTPIPSKSLMLYGENKSFHQQPQVQPSFLQAARLGL